MNENVLLTSSKLEAEFQRPIDVHTLDRLLCSIEEFRKANMLQRQTWQAPMSTTLTEARPCSRHCVFFRLNELRHDSSFPQREAMENVLSTMAGLDSQFVYLLTGDECGVNIHLGVAHSRDPELSTYDVGTILEDAFVANFQGSSLHRLSKNEPQQEVFERLTKARRGGLITGIPSFNEQRESQDAGFQGIERLINGMLGKRWQLLIVCAPASSEELDEAKRSIYYLYNKLHAASKVSVQHSGNIGENHTHNKGTNDSQSVTKGRSENSNTESSSTGINSSKTKSRGTNFSESDGSSIGYSFSATQEKIKKELVDLIEYIDTELLERVKIGLAKGMFKTATYALAENRSDFSRLSQLIKSIFQGDSSQFSPLRVHTFPNTLSDNSDTMERLLCGMQHWHTDVAQPAAVPCLFSHSINAGRMSLSTLLTPKELSVLAGLPTREVPGIPMVEGVDFGVNPVLNKSGTQIEMGKVLHRGNQLSGKPVSLDLDDLCKHVFVTGVTGSGKTTTCQKLLLESNLPFMVIEPAKTEYRALANKVKGLKIFTLGNERLAPLRLNPFELFRFESVTGHVDLLKAAFAAAFPMEAAMPYMLEDAIYTIYEKRGWDISGMQLAEEANRLCEDPWNPSVMGRYWPTMDDLIIALGEVVDKEGFDARLANDYRASLVSRLRNLTVGSKGSMLNCRISTDFEMLMTSKVVLEMEDLKDPQDKALMMGLILARVGESIKERQRRLGGGTKHLTIVEEAHRLLAHPEPSSSDSSRHSVVTFADMLAEIRKYGEGLVIVDQIPGKLTPEVLKNTNTKIIHKLFARDDREAMGDAIGLEDVQKSWLAKLKTGEVVIFSGQWLKPVHAKVERLENTGDPTWELLEKLFEKMFLDQQTAHFPAACSVTGNRFNSKSQILIFRELISTIRHCIPDATKDSCKTDADFFKIFSKYIHSSNARSHYEKLAASFEMLETCLAAELCAGQEIKEMSLDDYRKNIAHVARFIKMSLCASGQLEMDRELGMTLRNLFYVKKHNGGR